MRSIIEIYVNDKPLKNPIRAKYCDTFLCRLRGLMFRNIIDLDEGLLLVQNRDSKSESSIHMLAVSMDLGVIWINSGLIIVDKIIAKSWRPAYFPAQPARYTLEIHPDRISEFNVGDRVSFNEI
jgi:uncharacterized membrane protein (UPF0127 family)